MHSYWLMPLHLSRPSVLCSRLTLVGGSAHARGNYLGLRNAYGMWHRFVEQIAHFVVGDLVRLRVANNVRSACHDCLLTPLGVPDELKALP